MWDTWVQSLGWEDPLEKGKATCSSILVQRIPWTVHGVAKGQTRLSNFHLLHFSFRKTAKLGRYRDFPYTTCPHTCVSSSIINSLHKSGMFVTIDEPALTHHSHPTSMVYLRVHSWCFPFCGFVQKYKDMYPPLWYHSEFLAPLIILCLGYSSLPHTPTSGNH